MLLRRGLTPADVQDTEGAQAIIRAIRRRRPWLKHLSADGAYDHGKLTGAAAYRDFVIEIVRKLAGQQGFHVLPRRWVIERSFGWMRRWRRLVRDDEERCDVSQAMIHVGMGRLPLRRISHP
jgi:transposase